MRLRACGSLNGEKEILRGIGGFALVASSGIAFNVRPASADPERRCCQILEFCVSNYEKTDDHDFDTSSLRMLVNFCAPIKTAVVSSLIESNLGGEWQSQARDGCASDLEERTRMLDQMPNYGLVDSVQELAGYMTDQQAMALCSCLLADLQEHGIKTALSPESHTITYPLPGRPKLTKKHRPQETEHNDTVKEERREVIERFSKWIHFLRSAKVPESQIATLDTRIFAEFAKRYRVIRGITMEQTIAEAVRHLSWSPHATSANPEDVNHLKNIDDQGTSEAFDWGFWQTPGISIEDYQARQRPMDDFEEALHALALSCKPEGSWEPSKDGDHINFH